MSYNKRWMGKLSPDTKAIVEATMQLNELERALRLTMNLLDRMGLSKDQKKALKQLRDLTISIIEITRGINLMIASTVTGDPFTAALGMANMIAGAYSESSLAGGQV